MLRNGLSFCHSASNPLLFLPLPQSNLPAQPQVHCNNMHTHGVSVFRQVDCLFKRSLATAWEPTPVSQQLAVDVRDPSARSLTVDLGGRLGKFVQCHFHFAGEWMLFSEVGFLSGELGWVGWLGAEPCRWRAEEAERGFEPSSPRSWPSALIAMLQLLLQLFVVSTPFVTWLSFAFPFPSRCCG